MDPFSQFLWSVDQDGYSIEQDQSPVGLLIPRVPSYSGYEFGGGRAELVQPKGGPLRQYRPLHEEGLWRRFAETCTSHEGILGFANQFGLLADYSRAGITGQRVSDFLITAHRLAEVAELIDLGDRFGAAAALHRDDNPFAPAWPQMQVAVLPSLKNPDRLEYQLRPMSLRDALLHQAAEAILNNRRFRRCRNDDCLNWFRLGPHASNEGGKTITARREFCSDRCRVAHARRQKRETTANA